VRSEMRRGTVLDDDRLEIAPRLARQRIEQLARLLRPVVYRYDKRYEHPVSFFDYAAKIGLYSMKKNGFRRMRSTGSPAGRRGRSEHAAHPRRVVAAPGAYRLPCDDKALSPPAGGRTAAGGRHARIQLPGTRYSRTARLRMPGTGCRSEEHTSELQSRFDLVCRLLLEKKT